MMKRGWIIVFAILLTNLSYAQKNEFSVQIHSGVTFLLGGEHTSVMLRNESSGNNFYTNDPYGFYGAVSYGFSGQFQRITKSNLIFGVQVGVERLRSKVFIDRVQITGNRFPNPDLVEAEGQTYLNMNYLNFYPHIGKSFGLGNIDLQITFGTDLGVSLGAREYGEATTSNGTKVSTEMERSQPDLDLRLRGVVSAYYRKYGVYLGYSSGLTNYQADFIDTDKNVYSRIFRFGLSYKL